VRARVQLGAAERCGRESVDDFENSHHIIETRA
jgi:hypothetical protein